MKFIILSILITAISFDPLFADHHKSQDQKEEALAGSFPLQGWWKFESKPDAGEKIVKYLVSWVDKETGIQNLVDMNIEPSSKEIGHITRVFQVPTENPKVHNRLWVNNNGDYGKTTQVVEGNSMIATVVGSTSNGLLSAVIHTTWNAEKNEAQQFMSNVIDENSDFKTKTKTLFGKKISYNPLRNSDAIMSIERKINPDRMDGRLNRLLGKWNRTNEARDSKKIETFTAIVKGAAMLEKFSFYQIEGDSESLNGGGYQLSVKDPSNGKLSMWFINKNNFNHAGYWQIEGDKTFIQNYLDRRYVREVNNDKEVRAFYQMLKDGSYQSQKTMIFNKTP